MSKNPQQRHPKGLYILFGTEAWERFSYYGMRAILVLYLCAAVNASQGHPGLGFNKEDALAVYGIYTGLVYLTPLIGGFISDNIIGARKAVIIGGVLMAMGEFCMIFPALLYPALTLLIIGNGFFKPNISNMVGGLYEENDPRRDGGYTIFYMGINLGAFLAPLICGFLASQWGYKWGFCAACIGMVIGQITFNLGLKRLGLTGFPPDMTDVTPETKLRRRDWRDIALYVVGMSVIVLIAMGLGHLFFSGNPNAPLPIAVVLMTLSASVLFSWQKKRHSHHSSPGPAAEIASPVQASSASDLVSNTATTTSSRTIAGLTPEEWQRVAVILILSGFVIFFWMGYEQAGGTMTLFAEERTNRNIGSYEFPASWFQCVAPLVICLFAPLFSMMWYAWDNSKYKIATSYKMAIGLFFLSLGFVVMYYADSHVICDTKGQVLQGVSPLWLVAVYYLHTMGELCLSPVGLSMISKLSPPKMVSLMMGCWLGASAVANYCAGMLQSFLSHFAVNMWLFLIITSAGAGAVLLLLGPILKRWSHGR